MPLPIDLILVRHGESEGNVAAKASRKGDDSFFTPEFRDRHSREFRLTDRGIQQAQVTGEWIRKNVNVPIDYCYVSDYIRAKETAYYLQLPDAKWKEEYQLRERDKALMDNLPVEEQKRLFAMEMAQYNLDPFLASPAGGGESIPLLCLRLKTDVLQHLARQRSDSGVIIVCHGHVMRAIQMEMENLSHDDFIRLDKSKEPADRILNCQILWYTRRDPDSNIISDKTVAVRSVCPSCENSDYGWRRIERKLLSNDDLIAEVNRYPRHVK